MNWISDEDDWTSEATWYKANPSLGETIDIEKVRSAYISARENVAEIKRDCELDMRPNYNVSKKEAPEIK